jgi:hypothetical protein
MAQYPVAAATAHHPAMGIDGIAVARAYKAAVRIGGCGSYCIKIPRADGRRACRYDIGMTAAYKAPITAYRVKVAIADGRYIARYGITVSVYNTSIAAGAGQQVVMPPAYKTSIACRDMIRPVNDSI